jgi:hypothetical protein
MKPCPFCAELIQEEAIKCKHCQEFLMAKRPAEPWYCRTTSLVMMLLTVGPFVLPFVWMRASFSRNTKIAWTVVVLVLTGLAVAAMVWAVGQISNYYRMVL